MRKADDPRSWINWHTAGAIAQTPSTPETVIDGVRELNTLKRFKAKGAKVIPARAIKGRRAGFQKIDVMIANTFAKLAPAIRKAYVNPAN